MANVNGKNFLDFFLAALSDEELFDKFIGIETPATLEKFFQNEGYPIDYEECKKILRINRQVKTRVLRRAARGRY